MSQELTELDRLIQEIATKNYQQFVTLVGKDAIQAAKICLLRRQHKTIGQITTKLGVTKSQVETACKKCED